LRSEAKSEFVAMGPKPPKDAVSLAAQHRQVNACALALKVREALGRALPKPAVPAE
jgi:hypothetical protein